MPVITSRRASTPAPGPADAARRRGPNLRNCDRGASQVEAVVDGYDEADALASKLHKMIPYDFEGPVVIEYSQAREDRDWSESLRTCARIALRLLTASTRRWSQMG